MRRVCMSIPYHIGKSGNKTSLDFPSMSLRSLIGLVEPVLTLYTSSHMAFTRTGGKRSTGATVTAVIHPSYSLLLILSTVCSVMICRAMLCYCAMSSLPTSPLFPLCLPLPLPRARFAARLKTGSAHLMSSLISSDNLGVRRHDCFDRWRTNTDACTDRQRSQFRLDEILSIDSFLLHLATR